MRLKKQLSVIVLVTAIIIGLTKLNSCSDSVKKTTETCLDCPCDTLRTPHYCKLKNDIFKMSKQKWDKSRYNQIKIDIQNYSSTTPDPLISEEEANNLTMVLQSNYMRLITDSVKQFLKNGKRAENTHLKGLKEEIIQLVNSNDKKLTDGVVSLIDTYYEALNWCWTIKAYTDSSAYNARKSKNYESKIKDYQTMVFIKENKEIQDLINWRISLLEDHAVLGKKFNNKMLRGEIEEKIKEDSCHCNTETYKKFYYYKLRCELLKDSIYNLSINY